MTALDAARVRAAIAALRRVAPNAGSYLSESDFFKETWEQESWGANSARLRRIKRRYDPRNIFAVHHGVGSET